MIYEKEYMKRDDSMKEKKYRTLNAHENATIRVIQTSEYYDIYVINSQDLMKYGHEKAIILGNISKMSILADYESFHLGFPFLEKKEFYRLLDELINEGLISIQQQDQVDE